MVVSDLLTVAGLAVILALLVQIIKPAIKSEWVPLVALALGIIIAVLASWTTDLTGKQDIANAVLTGVLAAFSAIGIYSTQQPTGILRSKG